MESSDNTKIIEERKKKIFGFFTKKSNLLIYGILAIIVYLSVRIRTRNLSGLRDVTNGGWTLGPDLDPFLFLRWAKHIVAEGSLYAIDYMRNVPLGFNIREELLLHPYMIAWFHKIATIFGSSSVEQSAVIYPVFFFAITVIAFFLFVRKMFLDFSGEKKANTIALISSFFLSVMPPLLPRTIAGIPEKESAAFFFLFISLYFFLCAWNSERKYLNYVYAGLAGITTAMMALVWGAYIYIHLTIGIALYLAFFLKKTNLEKLLMVVIWLVISSIIMSMYSIRYSFSELIVTTTFLIPLSAIALISLHELMTRMRIFDKIKFQKKYNIPEQIISLCVMIIAGILVVALFFGPSFIFDKSRQVISTLVNPVSDRLGVTVAENRQPYFSEWTNNFGPVLKGIPIFFWLFILGSIYLFASMLKKLKSQEKVLIVSGYAIFILALVFSRYSESGALNGTSPGSLFLYLIGFISLIGTFAFCYYMRYKSGQTDLLKELDFGLILLFSFFFFSIISARAAVRLVMVLVPASAVMVAYLISESIERIIEALNKKEKKILVVSISIIVILLSIYSGYVLYKSSIQGAGQYVPGIYNQQWQIAMSWVRTNTPESSVFGHWWDYGYWVQSIGERATVLDGGNFIPYWNHFMGRYALTGTSENEALEFLYAHNTTHFLIDSTDLGKYTAFSSIGSDENYDRRSWINTFLKDSSQTSETKNSTIFVYRGGFSLDEDLIYTLNGSTISLPGVNSGSASNIAGLGAIFLEIDNHGDIYQPIGVFIYANNQYRIPLRYAFYNNSLIDFGSGTNAGIFVMPSAFQQNSGELNLDPSGAILYLSSRTVDSQLAKLYLFNKQTDNFKLVHIQDDYVVSALKSQGVNVGEMVYFQGLRGPIKIWEISYPNNIRYEKKYLETIWPAELRRA